MISPRPGADELVEVLAVRVVARVDDDAAVLRLDGGGVLVLDAPEGGAFDRGGLRVGRVDLDHPAEPVGLVAVPSQVEAGVDSVPAVLAALGAEAVALLRFRQRDARRCPEATIPVLLT